MVIISKPYWHSSPRPNFHFFQPLSYSTWRNWNISWWWRDVQQIVQKQDLLHRRRLVPFRHLRSSRKKCGDIIQLWSLPLKVGEQLWVGRRRLEEGVREAIRNLHPECLVATKYFKFWIVGQVSTPIWIQRIGTRLCVIGTYPSIEGPSFAFDVQIHACQHTS